MKNIKVCHISTVHPRFDVRIFHKECKSLSNIFDRIYLVVADGLGDEEVDNIIILDTGKPSGRKDRFLHAEKKALTKALSTNADVFHLHDPELLRITSRLLKHKKIVIYDSHEDLPRQILNKPYIPRALRGIISNIVESFENRKAQRLNGIVAATPHIRDRFKKINRSTIDINNYPKIGDIKFHETWSMREKYIAYIGGIFKTRGIFETLDAINGTDIKLLLAGKFSPLELEKECPAHPGWENVDYLGFLDRQGINNVLSKARLGMVILEATPSYLVSLPVKMFEYMASGLPVIASDFPLWNQIISDSKCGICVDQTNPNEIKSKIEGIIDDISVLSKMGQNGRLSIENTYNWEIEETKLFDFYKSLINN